MTEITLERRIMKYVVFLSWLATSFVACVFSKHDHLDSCFIAAILREVLSIKYPGEK